ncbi:MAG: hypothetical protein COB71_11470 [Thiotrichales bacterium]|nr:MAG: hypothetical protein COB71_13170 [Thiotrichales bacterium]PCI11409.1 MAG: hypothetical protein COB71_11470 [Thiotrichales bacterium]
MVIKKTTTLFGIALAALLASSSTLACSAMGPKTHVGNITEIDRHQHTLTIMDAETQQPITFSVDNKQLMALNSSSGQVIVRYRDGDDGQLIATSVQ